MKSIWKYKLEATSTVFEIPLGAKILTVQEQHGAVCIWVEVNVQSSREKRKFALYGTGHNVSTLGTYIGSAMLCNGNLVLHVYEEQL